MIKTYAFHNNYFAHKMDRMAMEANLDMILKINDFCIEKTISTKHNDSKLSTSENNQFKNCFTKYFASTQIFVQNSMAEGVMK